MAVVCVFAKPIEPAGILRDHYTLSGAANDEYEIYRSVEYCCWGFISFQCCCGGAEMVCHNGASWWGCDKTDNA